MLKLKNIITVIFLAALSFVPFFTSAQNVPAKSLQKLVIPGDFPDPSVIRVGDTYYSTCSASEWGPIFALAKSTDLVNWSIVKYAMPTRPKWSTANYWAPELYHDGKKFFIYYTGRLDGGPLCVSVATADKAEGPWTDHGPVVCQTAGSIDAACIQDDNGRKYLVWKEDGNSVGKPTPIWAQELSKSGIIPVGEKFELFRNDTPWERNLVEGPFIMKKGDYFYCFYAGAGCCGTGCDYAIGVARSKTIKGGKWEKFGKNPILAGNDVWKCPGHGTVVSDTKGNDFFMYHAYSTESDVYVGRQALVSQIAWTADGWPEIKKDANILNSPEVSLNFTDNFTNMAASWRWPVEHQPAYKTVNGQLALTAIPESNVNKTGAVLGQASLSFNYVATATAKVTPGVASGLSAFGDINNAVGLSVSNGELLLWKVQRNKRDILTRAKAPAGKSLQFKLTVQQGKNMQYAYSTDGKSWKNIGEQLDGKFLPPWDRGVRIALVAQGKGVGYFDNFKLMKM